MATCVTGSSLKEPSHDPIDVILHKLESNNDKSLKLLAMQRLQKLATRGNHLRLPTHRLLKALSNNETVESLELWLPDYETDSSDTADDRQHLLTLLTVMLARNQTIRRLAILQSIDDPGWHAIMKGIQENDVVSQLAIEDSLPTCCSLFFASNGSISSLSINRYWMITPTTTSVDIVSKFFLDLRYLKPLRLLEINNFETEHIIAALEALNDHPMISKLELINCDLSTLNSFPMIPTLIHLRLIDCKLTEESLLAVSKSVSLQNESLELLDLRGNTVLSSHSACSILHRLVLSKSTKLTKLILELCNIDDIGLHILCGSGLQSNIQSINLRENKLSDCDVWSDKFINSELFDVDLSDNRIGNNAEAFDSFMRILCRSVKRLQLESCHLSAKSIDELCWILTKGCCQIRELNLSHNDAASEVALSISKLFCQNRKSYIEGTTLERVDLSSCRISDTFMETICESFSGSNSRLVLKDFILSCNEISNAGMAHLATILERVPNNLTRVDLQSNPFDKDGLEILSNCLAENSFNLTDVRLSLYSTHDLTAKSKIRHWLLLNRAGRGKITSLFVNQRNRHPADLPNALVEADEVYGLEAIYWLIRNCPWVLSWS
jgi:Ran GTPase-activating protein (RanGAP) involved in mRNA processing and transport